MKTYCIPESELKRIRESEKALCNPYLFTRIAAEVSRFNALHLIGRSSDQKEIDFRDSPADIMAWLFTQVMKNPNNFIDDEICDVFFYSSGKYFPAFAAITSFLGGGHLNLAPNHVSLQTAISGAREIAQEKRLSNWIGRIYILFEGKKIEDTEIFKLLEQISEENLFELIFIADHQKPCSELAWQFYHCGWEAAECDGHNFKAIDETLRNLREENPKRKPQVLVAHTQNSRAESYEKLAQKIYGRLSFLAKSVGLGQIRLLAI